ncbi:MULTISPECIES: HU family DNA-binding protein [Weissella]|jgi:Bacterial nucleoid DNA-binding protein|uniref:DNA-binding protein HU n=1 Tax=Weissella fermenti TaxID=2987699 RepID=A0ABT6D5N4_9LACO|nr:MULTISPECIES: HU family DNA-binding protein [Weissella]MBJ7689159.1 HU family DNA-binding protein [Weissella confusa]MCW0927885.1 HU family DNA-binding protein [Weissella sp. LMG 11983]MDA5458617.1 DNA-binding protein HBsu [Weissella confusa]MDF9300817.1 HU family DNA-binding protein [Weissella sp. BK2]
MALSKSDFISKVADKSELTKKDAGSAVDAFLAVIEESLVAGESVSFVGFGSFEVRDRAARKGRNPQTGEEIEIAAAKMPAFKPGKSLKEAVNK